MLLFRPFIYIREINKKLFSSRIRYAKCETITKFQVAWGEERCCRVNESVHQCQTPELFFFCFTRALLSFESLEGAMEDTISKKMCMQRETPWLFFCTPPIRYLLFYFGAAPLIYLRWTLLGWNEIGIFLYTYIQFLASFSHYWRFLFHPNEHGIYLHLNISLTVYTTFTPSLCKDSFI